jgi:hypothetical protein
MNEKKVVEALLAHGEQLVRIEEQMATKQDIRGIVQALDEQTVILRRLDEERVFDGARIRRAEDRIDHHEAEIRELKGSASVASTT